MFCACQESSAIDSSLLGVGADILFMTTTDVINSHICRGHDVQISGFGCTGVRLTSYIINGHGHIIKLNIIMKGSYIYIYI